MTSVDDEDIFRVFADRVFTARLFSVGISLASLVPAAVKPRFCEPFDTLYVCSMPNIHVQFCSSRDLVIESSELADGQTRVHFASLQLHSDVPEDLRCDETEPAVQEAAAERPKTIWKRTKRFLRRVFCCA
ncbi:unnamed protein product [Macrosiphum euphorbiae]|uniref:Uncharacterized protein n=1 Tax=Macrosiphum euphorbiae TaxID=13131 RepID=A0AAV0VTD7_9HEMI|nr:unnamed protein product [Macrosiphum euphorbiae]